MLPTVDVCFIEYPENPQKPPEYKGDNEFPPYICKLLRLKDQKHHQDRQHHQTSQTDNFNGLRHIRHRHHYQNEDPRSRMQNKTIIWRHDEWLNLNNDNTSLNNR